jgi:catechol-2,3-dioxygenase
MSEMSSIRPDGVLVFTIWAQEIEATSAFYRDVVGLRLLPGHGGRVAFELGRGAHLVIAQGPPASDGDPGRERFPAVAFAVPDLDRAVEHLRARDVPLPWGIETHGQARWVMFHDPAGNLVELAQAR